MKYDTHQLILWNLIKTINVIIKIINLLRADDLNLPVEILLKEVRNRILRTILVWLLFRLIRLYVGLYFLPLLMEN